MLKYDDVCICSHFSPDGDAIGSGLALRQALVQLGKDVHILLADDQERLNASFMCLVGSDSYIPAKEFSGDPSLFIVVDAPNAERIGKSAASLHALADLSITIDHHYSPERYSDLSYTDPEAASTSILIWELVKHLDIVVDTDLANCTLAGLMTDTGSFQYQNADERAFRCASEMISAGASTNFIAKNFFERRSMASLRLEAIAIDNMELLNDGRCVLSWVSQKDLIDNSANKADCEPLINVLRELDGINVACMLREQKDCVRGSIRAKDDTDVSEIAGEFGGGGHRAASGFTIKRPLEEAIELVSNRLSSIDF